MLDEDDPLAADVRAIEHVDRLLLAGFLIEAFEDEPDPVRASSLTLHRLALDAGEREAILDLVTDRDLLWSAAHQPGALEEERVLQLAAHLDTPETARTLYVLSALRSDDRERWELQRLRALHDLVQAVLADDELTGVEARNLVELRKGQARALLQGEPGPLARLEGAPRGYVVRTPPEAMARHARLLDPPPAREPRVGVVDVGALRWWIDVAWQDDPGRLASVTKVLAEHGLVVEDAVLATWPDGAVLDSFHVSAGAEPDRAPTGGRARPVAPRAARRARRPRRRGAGRPGRLPVAHGVRGAVHRPAWAAARGRDRLRRLRHRGAHRPGDRLTTGS